MLDKYGTSLTTSSVAPTATYPNQSVVSGPISAPFPTAPAVITSKTAQNDLNNIKTQYGEIQTNLQNQATKVAQDKAIADATAQQKAQAEAAKKAEADKLALEQQKAGSTGQYKLDANGNIVSNDAYGGIVATKGNFGSVVDASGKALTGIDSNGNLVFGSTATTSSPSAYSTLDQGRMDREKASADYQAQAKAVQDTINNIQNGTVPLTAGEQAQIDGLKQQFNQLIEDQKLINTGATGVAQIRGYQTGAGEYDPTFQAKTIGSIITAGANKVSDLNIKMASAVASLTQGFKDNKISAIKDAWKVYQDAATERSTTIEATIKDAQAEIKAAQEAKAKQLEADIKKQEALTKSINEIANDVLKNTGDSVLAATIASSPDIHSAMLLAGDNLQTASGTAGEYLFYKRDALSRGLVPMDYDSFATMDANRKRSIVNNVDTSGMTPKQVTIFNSLVDKQNKSPLVAANDRAVILKNVTDAVAADPSNASLQVSFIYSMIQALDTYQSAVREGEIGLISGTQGLGEKIANLASQVEKGNPLNPSKIKEYVATSKLITDSIQKAADLKKKAFSAQAKIAGVGDAFEEYQTALVDSDPIKAGVEAKSQIDAYIQQNPDEAETIALLYETPSPAFGGGLPTDEQIAEYLGLK